MSSLILKKVKKWHISYNVSKLEYTQLLSFNIVYFSPEIMSMIMIFRYYNKLATLEKMTCKVIRMNEIKTKTCTTKLDMQT